MFTIQAPAKLNLTLEVLGRRTDGYHEIRSVIQTISLHDTLRFEACDRLVISADSPEWDAEKSLVSAAVDLLKYNTGTTRGCKIVVSKRIPLVSGLGGESSDAAAALMGLNRLWELSLSHNDLHVIGAKLGSDVPFFLYGGTALVAGRGEKITRLPGLCGTKMLIILPDVPRPAGKTGLLYASLKPEHFTDGDITARLVKIIKSEEKPTDDLFYNVFENVIFAWGAELSVYRSHILKCGAGNIHLAGSGPALFTVVNNEIEAEELGNRLKGQNMKPFEVTARDFAAGTAQGC